jgi:hypothetical protein
MPTSRVVYTQKTNGYIPDNVINPALFGNSGTITPANHTLIAGNTTTSQILRIPGSPTNSDINIDNFFASTPKKDTVGKIINVAPDIFFTPISRATSAVEDIAPTLVELADPVTGSTASILLSSGIQEFWKYTGAWSKIYRIVPAAGGVTTTVNNTLTSTSTTEALSAAQGKVLNDNNTLTNTSLATLGTTVTNLTTTVNTKSRNKNIARTSIIEDATPTLSEFGVAAVNGDTATVVLSNGVQELYNFTSGSWVKSSRIAPAVLDGNNVILPRSNNTTGIAPTSIEIPSPINGDTADVYLSDGTREVYAHNGTTWALIKTIPASSLDGNDKHISRGNSTVNIAPTTLEIPSPVNGDTAKIILSDKTIEFWSYNGTIWARDYLLPPALNNDYVFGFVSTAGTNGDLPETLEIIDLAKNLIKANLYIISGTSPASITTIKIKSNSTDYIQVVVPANTSFSTTNLVCTVLSTAITSGTHLFMNLSQAMPGCELRLITTTSN